MTPAELIANLQSDRPQFHYADEAIAKRCEAVGFNLPVGDCSMNVSFAVLRWIADNITPDMTTVETGVGYTTCLFAAVAKHHYALTVYQYEADRIGKYLAGLGVPADELHFVIGSTDRTLPNLELGQVCDFAYIDGCHGYPLPALDWHYADKLLKVGGILGMDNAELRAVREHCDFLEENGTYECIGRICEGCFVYFYRKLADQQQEWVDQAYSRAKKDPCDWRWPTRIKRVVSRWVKPHLF